MKIGVFTSGGDAPGMNAAIRGVVRASAYNKIEIFGIYRGFEGMIEGDIVPLKSSSVSNIIQRGGTILKSARSLEFKNVEGRNLAYKHLMEYDINCLIAIGGDGTFTGTKIFCEEHPDISMVGIPGTIDNDLFGTDYTIGYDTALNTVVEAVDKIRDTASSHNRLFFVEVMGRDAGFIALRSGIGVGAEAILIPESPTYMESLITKLKKGWRKNKTSSIIIVAEGEKSGGAYEVAKKVSEKFTNYETRVTVLGHIQRGGNPSALDRVLASRLGVAAVDALHKGINNCMVGIINNKVAYTPFVKAIKHNYTINKELLNLVEILSI